MAHTIIRPYHSSDASDLLLVFRQNIPAFFDPGEEKDLQEYLQSHAHGYSVIEEAGEILGGAGIRLSGQGKIGHITWIFFSSHSQGRGLGRNMMRHCLEELERQAVQKIEITTSQHAWQFFAKFGFELTETKKDYWGKGLDLYRMEKVLLLQ